MYFYWSDLLAKENPTLKISKKRQEQCAAYYLMEIALAALVSSLIIFIRLELSLVALISHNG